jgi:hypothetical protein
MTIVLQLRCANCGDMGSLIACSQCKDLVCYSTQPTRDTTACAHFNDEIAATLPQPLPFSALEPFTSDHPAVQNNVCHVCSERAAIGVAPLPELGVRWFKSLGAPVLIIFTVHHE